MGVSTFSRAAGRWSLIALAVVMVAAAPEAGDRADADRSWRASWQARQAQEAERRRVEQIHRAYERRRAMAHARMRSEPDAIPLSTPPAGEAMCPVLADPEARRAFERGAFQRQFLGRRGQALRRTGGLPSRTGLSVFSASNRGRPVFSGHGSSTKSASARPSSMAAVFAAASASASASALTESVHLVPLFPSASDALGRQGFARVINHSDEAGEVSIEASDDQGMSYGPLTLSIDANETIHFNSNDLEDGNADKGLSGSTGSGEGDWRLEFSSGLDIEALSYIRTTDGFLTAMHDTVPSEEGRHEVSIFNPGSNANQESLLRLVNPGDVEAEVTITAVDDRGASPGDGATVTLPAGSSATYTSAELESGSAAGLEGSIGDGSGKWRLVVESEQEITAMSLLSSPTGHLTNLSTAPDNEEDGIHAVPLFPSASDAQGRQGFLRVMNRSDESGEVTVGAHDDTEREYEVVTLAMGANETKHFNSDDLELGNADKGLAGSTGAGEGDWRPGVDERVGDRRSVLYPHGGRVPDGDARRGAAVGEAPPGGGVQPREQREPAEPAAAGEPGRGARRSDDHWVRRPGRVAWERRCGEHPRGVFQDADRRGVGDRGDFEGALDDGAGKWRLTVNADRPISAMSLLSSPTGHLTNLSTAPERGAGPVETAVEAHEALISPVVQSKCVNCHVEGACRGIRRWCS